LIFKMTIENAYDFIAFKMRVEQLNVLSLQQKDAYVPCYLLSSRRVPSGSEHTAMSWASSASTEVASCDSFAGITSQLLRSNLHEEHPGPSNVDTSTVRHFSRARYRGLDEGARSGGKIG
jgi:hypothetical protein